jgi:hypothetical protein
MAETPLAKKLGIEDGTRIALVGPPDGFPAALGPSPPGAEIRALADGPIDVLLFSAKTRRELEAALPALTAALRATGGLRLARPKKSAGVPTDLSDDVVQEADPATGLVDNKVCAIDAVWSALRFVVRVEERAAGRGG